jgi:hypothetical protein
VKGNEELRHKFEELMKISEGEPRATQECTPDEEIRKIGGNQMMEAFEALNIRMEESDSQRTAEVRAARSREFDEAQRRLQRGLHFANYLPPSADVHYAGKGVSLGTADKPIFWYHPANAKTYRVMYADLSVRDAEAPSNVPDAQPASAPTNPEK